VGTYLRAKVTATNGYGSTTRLSTSAGLVGAPGSLTQPTISGQTVVLSTLTAQVGTWTGSPTSFAFQWMRCDSSALICVAIGGAQASTYGLTVDDLGHRLRVRIVATNAVGGSEARLSAPTGLVT
jgi:hypothetical protein